MSQIEVVTVAPPLAITQSPAVVPPEDYLEEVTLPPRMTKSPGPSTLDFRVPGLFGPDTGLGTHALHYWLTDNIFLGLAPSKGSWQSHNCAYLLQDCLPVCYVCVSVAVCTAMTQSSLRFLLSPKTPHTSTLASTRSLKSRPTISSISVRLIDFPPLCRYGGVF